MDVLALQAEIRVPSVALLSNRSCLCKATHGAEDVKDFVWSAQQASEAQAERASGFTCHLGATPHSRFVQASAEGGLMPLTAVASCVRGSSQISPEAIENPKPKSRSTLTHCAELAGYAVMAVECMAKARSKPGKSSGLALTLPSSAGWCSAHTDRQ